MNLYLTEIRYRVTPYDCKEQGPVNIIRLVKADTVEEATMKANKFINDKTVEYSIYYCVESVHISECIE